MTEEKERKVIEFKMYGDRVMGKYYPASHKYYVSVDGSMAIQRPSVTGIIGIKDKSIALQKWQQVITLMYLHNKISEKVKIDMDEAIQAVIQCDLQRDEAADIGKEIHAWIESYIRHNLEEPGYENIPESPKFPEAINGVSGFFDWKEEHKVKFHSTEKIVYSLKYDYIGIEDLTFTADGLFCDGDFKSSNGLYNPVRLQTAAYAMGRMEDKGKKTQGRWAIRLSKYTEDEYVRREELKLQMKRIIAKVMGWKEPNGEIKPYQVFEAKFLDNSSKFLKRDFEAFLHAKALHEWNKETDPYTNGDNW